jgi:serine/threonine protein kinase
LGTEGYMAPEIATKHYDGRKTDIFAAGVILFIMYAGNPPFEKAVITDPYYKLLK